MKRITEIKVKCPVCGWQGAVIDAEPDDEGTPCCPDCMCGLVVASVTTANRE